MSEGTVEVCFDLLTLLVCILTWVKLQLSQLLLFIFVLLLLNVWPLPTPFKDQIGGSV